MQSHTRTIYDHTPKLTVNESRGLVVRSVEYYRAAVSDMAEARVNRTLHDPSGRATAQWDPRLFIELSAPANLKTIYTLSGATLGANSVDAGWRVALLGETGQTVHNWDGRGSQRWMLYDEQIRLTAVFEGMDCTERYLYGNVDPALADENQCGQVVRHDDPAGTRHFKAYAMGGELLEQAQHFLQVLDTPDWPLPISQRDALLEPGAGARTLSRFNAVGEVLQQTDAAGNRQGFDHTVDGLLREAWLHLKDAPTRQTLVNGIAYNAQGQIERQTLGNGVVRLRDYSPEDGRLIRLRSRRDNGEPLQDLNYVYDPVGNILSIEDEALPVRHFANQRIDPINRYTYDSLYQLIEAAGVEAGSSNKGPYLNADPHAVANFRQTYNYDAGGNLLELNHQGPQRHGRLLTAAKYSNRCLPEQNGRPPTQAEIAAGFDANGNLLELEKGRTLTWDARNQLVQVQPVGRESSLNDTERYIYGGGGLRQRKVCTRQTRRRTMVKEVRYLPGLELHIDHSTSETREVIWVDAGHHRVQVSTLKSVSPEGQADAHFSYPLVDHLGSCTMELDAQADIITQQTYHPFGTTAFYKNSWLVAGSLTSL
jgi:insecticidal toxin complex protein TccC